MVRVLDKVRLAISEVEGLSELREEVLRRSRRWLSIARSSILNVRRMRDLKDEERRLIEILKEMKNFMDEAKLKLGASSCHLMSTLQDSMQEVVEAVVLCRLLMGEEVPSHSELGVGAREYLLGVSDVIGELRRVTLDFMRQGDVERAENLLELMEEIYEGLSSVSLPDSLIPLRRKVDEARILIERTLSELVFVKASRRGGSGVNEG